MTMTMAGGVGGGPGTWNIYEKKALSMPESALPRSSPRNFKIGSRKLSAQIFFLQTFGTIVALWNLDFSNMFQYHY